MYICIYVYVYVYIYIYIYGADLDCRLSGRGCPGEAGPRRPGQLLIIIITIIVRM